jgi:hypothetical protein
MEIFETDQLEWEPVAHNSRSGVIMRKFIRESELVPGVGYGCDLYFYTSDGEQFTTPRHHHDFDQIRFAISGTMDFGHQNVTQAGDIAYFPAGAFYGPQKIDEAKIFIIQWSPFWVTRAQHDAAMIEMTAEGEFTGGFYVARDESGVEQKKDSLNAIWEHVFHRPSFFPEIRYSGPVVMHPDAYQWVATGQGTSIKMLGRFTERDLQIYKVRWDDEESKHQLGAERTSCVFVQQGSVSVTGTPYGPEAMMWSEFGETNDLVGSAGAEAICIGFPLESPTIG